MEETIIFKPIKGTDDLKIFHLRVFKIVHRELGDRTGRVDYGLIAAELHVEWNNVRYAVQALVRAGVLDKRDGQLSVKKKIVL